MHPFDRYAALTDLAALNAASDRPLRKSARVNTLKCSVENFKDWAVEKGWSLTPVPWWSEGFFIDRTDLSIALGRDIRHLLGHFYMQEAASMLPVALLDPQPGEAVLDLCAAPGSKTTQIAARFSPTPDPSPGGGGEFARGVVVANDMQEKRLRILNDALQRTGATSVVITRKVGQWFSKHLTERFDRVVCDAPCTAQGTARKDPAALQYCSTDSIAKAARLQYQLLEAAVHAAKVGGRIVYSTCTLTPEENEGVVLEILNKFSDQLEVVHPKEALPSGLKWDMSAAISDSETVQKTLRPTPNALYPFLRLWPQTYDTEGFFCAVLKKVQSTRAVEPLEMYERVALPFGRKKTEAVSKLFMEQFGADFRLPGECLVEKGNFLLLVSQEAHGFPLPATEYAMGIPYAKILPDGRFRVTNEMASLRGHLAQSQILELSEEQLGSLLAGKDLPCDPKLRGDTILRFRGISLGLGLAKEGVLLNRLPRWVVKNASAKRSVFDPVRSRRSRG
ncbi:MAG: NOL1/NOP2/sun family putative RNA methylase [Candidatus Peribacteraceae bacterium]|nr:NOL1/NOP2/sun family putative RNA methylase [Candidatus Peribacteraceae bacterium]MDD5742930.1 NOL1/NOP2/sun family putative RNA methylase [Candidatus Peribacteraceae bacterium]